MPNRQRKLPSANLLWLFESAARLGSFTRAAEELQVSQPAVSHGVKTLEQQLGVNLFRREHRGVSLTEAGRYFFQELTIGFDHIYRAAGELQRLQRDIPVVTLSVSTATATYWLLPRVADFKRRFPDIELRCLTTDDDAGRIGEGVDLGIPLGGGPWPHYHAWHFVDEVVFPVCSPGYLQAQGSFTTLVALPDLTLIHLEERYAPRMGWGDWLRHFGVEVPRNLRGPSFNDYSIVIQAALEGQGVALGWRHIVDSLLRQGRLVRPLPQAWETDNAFYIVAPVNRPLSSAAVSLRDWLTEAVG